MIVRRILVTINTEDDDLELEDYIDAIKDACEDVEARAHVAGDCQIEVGEFLG